MRVVGPCSITLWGRVIKFVTEHYLSLSEPLRSISSGRVGKILGELFFDGDVICQRDVVDDHIVRAPLVKQLDLGQFLRGGGGGGEWRIWR